MKKFIIVLLITVILASLVLFTPLFSKREIIISGKDTGTKKVIDLGFLGWFFPSKIKGKERVNLLFLGVPGEGNSAPNLTDAIIILNTTPKGEKPIGISIPRDLFVKTPDGQYYTKINALYERHGIEAIKNKIKEITDLDIDYFIVLDLGGVKKIIDQFNGIDVIVENDIYDPQFPGADDTYTTFSLNAGTHHLDGETALKYIRSRHQSGGDFARIKRQQQVVSILKDKILSLNLIWNFSSVLKIWKTLKNHTYTDIGFSDIKYAWSLAKRTNLDEIKFITISNQPNEDLQLLTSGYVTIGNKQAYILQPKAGLDNYEEIKDYINQSINNPYNQ